MSIVFFIILQHWMLLLQLLHMQILRLKIGQPVDVEAATHHPPLLLAVVGDTISKIVYLTNLEISRAGGVVDDPLTFSPHFFVKYVKNLVMELSLATIALTSPFNKSIPQMLRPTLLHLPLLWITIGTQTPGPRIISLRILPITT
jgi:hypothetical protein